MRHGSPFVKSWRMNKEVEKAINQNASGALHLTDALHREVSLETRTATHPRTDVAQLYQHDFE